MRLLIIDDEHRLVEQLAAVLQDEGHTVTPCGLGEEGLRLALGGGYDLVLLDIQLPDRDGWSVLGELKRRGATVPVLMLTDHGGIDDRVKGFDLGADDYLPKPFDFRELLGRVRALARRHAGRENRVRAGELLLDLDTRRATRAGKALDLSPHEFLALLLLVRRQGAVVSREDITQQVLDRKHLGNSNSVEVLIRRLRAKVDDRFDLPLILTVRGQGYTFAASEAPAPPTPAVPRSPLAT